MPLEETLADVIEGLREQRYPNKESIAISVVLRLLQELGWNIFDNRMVCPDDKTVESRAHYTLCPALHQPSVLIEVTSPGLGEASCHEAVQLAARRRMSLLVVTDGSAWHFFFTRDHAGVEEGEVGNLQLLTTSPEACAEVLRRYLDFDRVATGQAFRDAHDDYLRTTRRRETRNALPRVWLELLDPPEGLLVDLLSEAVQARLNIKPDRSEVQEFLKRQATEVKDLDEVILAPPPPQPRERARAELLIWGETFRYGSAKDCLVDFLRMLAEKDNDFLRRCMSHPRNVGRIRKCISQSVDDLFPSNPDLQRTSAAAIVDNWYVGTNLSNEQKVQLMRWTGEVAGLKMGRDFKVKF